MQYYSDPAMQYADPVSPGPVAPANTPGYYPPAMYPDPVPGNDFLDEPEMEKESTITGDVDMVGVATPIGHRLLFGHPVALFILFFTEMWERFSYYLFKNNLTIFLVTAPAKGGWGWADTDASALGIYYSAAAYAVCIFGGLLADKWLGCRRSIIIGTMFIVAGHILVIFTMSKPVFIAGLVLVVIGTGFFKPCLTVILGGLYEEGDSRRDGAFSIYYGGVNIGAFLGIELGSYLCENVSYPFGFSTAAVFMVFGALQFYFIQSALVSPKGRPLGLSPSQARQWEADHPDHPDHPANKRDPQPFEEGRHEAVEDDERSHVPIMGMVTRKEMLRNLGCLLMCLASIPWCVLYAEGDGAAFTLFTKNYVNLALSGSGATIFKILQTFLTIIPLTGVSFVLFRMFRVLFWEYKLSNMLLGSSFVVIWAISIFVIIDTWKQEDTTISPNWFSNINTIYIIVAGPLYAKLWKTFPNMPLSLKFGLGTMLTGGAYGMLAIGGIPLPRGFGGDHQPPMPETDKVSMIWIILCFLFATTGELLVSPVGLAYTSKLASVGVVAMMFGFWGIMNTPAGFLANQITYQTDTISASSGISVFMLLPTIIGVGAGLIIFGLHPAFKYLQQGVR